MRVSTVICALPFLALSIACRDRDTAPMRVNVDVTVTVFGADCPVKIGGADLRVPLTPTKEDVELLTGALKLRGKKVAFRVRFVARDKPVRLMMGSRGWDIEPRDFVSRSNLGVFRVVEWNCQDTVEIGGALYRPHFKLSQKPDEKGAFRFEKGTPTFKLTCEADRIAYGRVSIGSASYHFVLADSDASGRFGDPGDHWRLLKDDALSAMNTPEPRRFSPQNLMPMSDPVHLAGGRMASFTSFDGKRAEIRVGKATITEEAYVAARMAKAREVFRKKYVGALKDRIAHYRDSKRPAAEVPLAWRHAIRREALVALAASADKPLFVLFDTEWCLYCQLMGALTLQDEEVVAFIRKHFCPVVVHSDLYVGNLAAERSIKGFPSVLVIDKAGREVCRVDGFSPPAKYLAGWKLKWPPEKQSVR